MSRQTTIFVCPVFFINHEIRVILGKKVAFYPQNGQVLSKKGQKQLFLQLSPLL